METDENRVMGVSVSNLTEHASKRDETAARRTAKIAFRVSPEELEEIRRAADNRFWTPSDFVRAATLWVVDKRRPTDVRRQAGPDVKAVARLVGETGRLRRAVGDLTDQARLGRVDAPAMHAMIAEMRTLRAEVGALREALAGRDAEAAAGPDPEGGKGTADGTPSAAGTAQGGAS